MNDYYRTFVHNVDIPEVNDGVKEIKIMLSFFIEKDGKISEIKTIKGYNKKTDNAFIKTLLKSGEWRPANHRGVVSRSQFTLPITIKISEDIKPYTGHHR